MRITLSPYEPLPDSADSLVLAVHGDILSVNGEQFDFGPLPDGAVLPAAAVGNPYFAGDVWRQGGELSVSLLFPVRSDASEAARFPTPIVVSVDGDVELPQ